jgi:hypothetical protein
VRGYDVEAAASRLAAQASEAHGDGAEAYMVLVAVFVRDGNGARLHHAEYPGDPGGTTEGLRQWSAMIAAVGDGNRGAGA